MFRPTDPQGSLFESSNLLPDDKRQRLELDWPGQFRLHALPLIDEEPFRGFYCADNGRPNLSVRMVVGVLILKEMFDLTDEETLYRLDYDLGWHVALALSPEDAHCCARTLLYFRAKLLAADGAKRLFDDLTVRIVEKLGISVARQRLDSTHISSNIARLSRLGLFCETLRVFLRELRKRFPSKADAVSAALRFRYIKENGKDTRYHDATSGELQRRLDVCARDTYRVAERFKQDAQVLGLKSYGILARLLLEQCEFTAEPTAAKPDDADASEPAVPMVLKEAREVASASLQSPHDTGATYSGHKGKGYEVQVAETLGNGDLPELITHVEVTAACESDAAATLPVVEALAEKSLSPKELTTDTAYASAENVIACEKRGIEIVAPVAGAAPPEPEPEPNAAPEATKTLADVTLSIDETQPVLCPAGHAAESVERTEKGAVKATFSRLHCASCPFRKSCPAKRNPNGTRTLKTTQREQVLAKRRRYEQTEAFRKRYAMRAGIEATNSELKRGHGLGRLRVRGAGGVKLAVYLKALACNVKRWLKHLAEKAIAGVFRWNEARGYLGAAGRTTAVHPSPLAFRWDVNSNPFAA